MEGSISQSRGDSDKIRFEIEKTRMEKEVAEYKQQKDKEFSDFRKEKERELEELRKELERAREKEAAVQRTSSIPFSLLHVLSLSLYIYIYIYIPIVPLSFSLVETIQSNPLSFQYCVCERGKELVFLILSSSEHHYL